MSTLEDEETTRELCTQEKPMYGHSKMAALCKSRRKASPETNTTSTLHFRPPDRTEKKFLIFKPSSLWYSVMADRAD